MYLHWFEEKFKIPCTRVHWFEEKTKYHIPGYMEFWFFFKSMNPGTSIWIFFTILMCTSWGRTRFLFFFFLAIFFNIHVWKNYSIFEGVTKRYQPYRPIPTSYQPISTGPNSTRSLGRYVVTKRYQPFSICFKLGSRVSQSINNFTSIY